MKSPKLDITGIEITVYRRLKNNQMSWFGAEERLKVLEEIGEYERCLAWRRGIDKFVSEDKNMLKPYLEMLKKGL